MSKYTVEKIKSEALNSLEDKKNFPDGLTVWIDVKGMRVYCDKVLFLCREIEELRKQVKP